LPSVASAAYAHELDMTQGIIVYIHSLLPAIRPASAEARERPLASRKAFMSVSLSSDSLSAVVGALRAAGCVFAEDEAALLAAEAATPADLCAMVDRREAGLPLEQVLGWAEFGGRRIAVEPRVLVPRRRTEYLAAEASTQPREAATRTHEAATRAHEHGHPDGPIVVDMCCG